MLFDFSYIVKKPSSVAVFNPANTCIILPIISSILPNASLTFYSRLLNCWENLLVSDKVAIAAEAVVEVAAIITSCQ